MQVKTCTVVYDLSQSTEALESILKPIFEAYPIGILVVVIAVPHVQINNVGISYEYAMYLTELPEDRLRAIIHLNCEVTAMITKLCIPWMTAFPPN